VSARNSKKKGQKKAKILCRGMAVRATTVPLVIVRERRKDFFQFDRHWQTLNLEDG
jgi:hypothetical protein